MDFGLHLLCWEFPLYPEPISNINIYSGLTFEATVLPVQAIERIAEKAQEKETIKDVRNRRNCQE